MWTGIHTVVSLPIAFAVNILLARVLGVTDYGRLAYLTTVIAIASAIAELGVTTALIQFGAKAHAKKDAGAVKRLLSASQGFRLMVTGPVTALAVLAIVRVDAWLLAIALAFGVAAPALLGNAVPALTIENRTDRAAQMTMAGNVVTQAAVVLTVLTIGTADAVWSARVISGGVLLALPLILISAEYRSAVVRPIWPWRLPRAFWKFALPTGGAGLIGALVMDRTELIVLEWFGDPLAMGIFGLAFGLAGHVYAPAQAFIGPLVPAVSALAEVEHDSVRRAFHRTTRAAATIGGLLVASALPALAGLVPTLYGVEFAQASDAMVIIGIGSGIMLLGSPHAAFLMARLGGRQLLQINAISLALNVVLALALIPMFGALGAAIACAGTFVGRTVQLSLGEAQALSIRPVELLASMGSMIVGLAITIGLWSAGRLLDLPPVPLACLMASIGMLSYVATVRLLRTGLSEGDVRAIEQALPKGIQRPAGMLLALVQGSKATR